MADKELLFKSRLPEAEVEIPGLMTVRVRGLSRAEVLSIQQVQDHGNDAIERRMLSLGLVNPALSEEEVGMWQQASVAGEMEPVTTKIMELSGMAKDAVKDAYQEVSFDNDRHFRDASGGDVEDDAGSDPGSA